METVLVATTPSAMSNGDATTDAVDDNPMQKDDYSYFEDTATNSLSVDYDEKDEIEDDDDDDEDDDDHYYQRFIDDELDRQFHEMLDEQLEQAHAHILQQLDDQIQKELDEQLYSSICQEKFMGRRSEHDSFLEYQYYDDSDASSEFWEVGSSDEPYQLFERFGAAAAKPSERVASVASINAAIQKLIDQHYRPHD